MKYQVIILKDEKRNKDYYYSYVKSDDKTLGNIEVEALPPYADVDYARACYYDGTKWVFDAEKLTSDEKEKEEEEKKQQLSVSTMEKLELFAQTIVVDEPQEENGIVLPKKEGYTWEKKCTNVNGVYHISWVLVKDTNYNPSNDGSDYLKAINWVAGMRVEKGLWYNVGDDYIWQAIKTGIPKSAEDKEYFDIP